MALSQQISVRCWISYVSALTQLAGGRQHIDNLIHGGWTLSELLSEQMQLEFDGSGVQTLE